MGINLSSYFCVKEDNSNNKKDKIQELQDENKKLRELALKQDAINREQFYMINILKNKENAKFNYYNDICCYKDTYNKNKKDKKEEKINNKDIILDHKYEHLVMSGGGIKGISFCGAVERLEQLNMLTNIKSYAGVSAGSIVAALLAIGYKPTELKTIISMIDMDKVIDDKPGYLLDAINVVLDLGFAPGDYIYNLLGELVKSKTGNADYTIKQLYEEKNINLVIVGTNINSEKSRYFYHNSPNSLDSNIPIRIAVRISMSIPFVFEPVKHDGELHVDGGMLDNYPLHVFDGDYPGDIKARLNLTVPNYKVLGLNIMNDSEVESYALCKKNDITNIYKFAVSFLSTFMAENERRMLVPSFWQRTIGIITPNYPISSFSIPQEQKDELFQLGKTYVDKFFDKQEDIDINKEKLEISKVETELEVNKLEVENKIKLEEDLDLNLD